MRPAAPTRYLLDTHTWLWAIKDSDELSRTARRILEDTSNEFYLSVASAWEMAIKTAKGTMALDPEEDLDVFITRTNLGAGIRTLPISVTEVCAVQTLPLHHHDPFDRLLIAQAVANDLTILSRDRAFSKYEAKVKW